MEATIRLVTQQQREEIAAKVRAEMQRQGLTNPALARRADLADKTISRVINGKGARYHTLEQLSKALGVDVRPTPVPPLGLGVENGEPSQLDRIEQAVKELDERVRLLAAGLAARDAEGLRRTEASAPTKRRART